MVQKNLRSKTYPFRQSLVNYCYYRKYGFGKSTLVNLILRFYDIDSGSILVDGVNVNETSQECLRSKIGYVPQKAVLFSGTLRRT
jgi:ABC-type multidrug transport system fused ATPase/permease subunit